MCATKFESKGSELILYALSAPIANPFLNKGSFSDRPTLSRLISISLFFSFNSQQGRDAFVADEESYMEKFRLTEEQKQCIRERDLLGMIREGGSIYYLAKIGPILGMNMQDFGGLQTGQSTEAFKAYLESQGVGKTHG